MKADTLLATLKRMTKTGYAVIDLETTGLDPACCEIAEIGLLVYRPGAVPMPASWLVKCTVTEESTRVTGITQKMADSGMSLHEAITEVLRRVYYGTDPPLDLLHFDGRHLCIVGHNILRYDAEVLDHAGVIEPRAKQLTRREDIVDTAALFKGGRLGWGQKDGESFLDYQMRVLDEHVYGLKYSLDYVCDELDINHSDCQVHRATGDVVMTHRVLQKIMAKLEAYEARRVRA